MAYTVTKLITKAFYLSNVRARDLDTVSGSDLSDGLELLNALLSFKTSDGLLIPYYQEFDVTLVQDQEKYFIPNLVDPESATFNIGPVRYSMLSRSRKDYFGSARIDNVFALPFSYRFERALDGTNLYVYFLPDGNYLVKIWGKFALTNVTLNQDLELVYDDFYIEYLRYGLAQMICNDWNIQFLPQNVKQLEAYEMRLRQTSPPDLTVMKMTTFTQSPGLNWGDVNVGKGWRPG